MKRFDRIAVLLGIILLVVVLTGVIPRFDLLGPLRGLGNALPWVLIGLFFVFRSGGCCGRRRCRTDASAGA